MSFCDILDFVWNLSLVPGWLDFMFSSLLCCIGEGIDGELSIMLWNSLIISTPSSIVCKVLSTITVVPRLGSQHIISYASSDTWSCIQVGDHFLNYVFCDVSHRRILFFFSVILAKDAIGQIWMEKDLVSYKSPPIYPEMFFSSSLNHYLNWPVFNNDLWEKILSCKMHSVVTLEMCTTSLNRLLFKSGNVKLYDRLLLIILK